MSHPGSGAPPDAAGAIVEVAGETVRVTGAQTVVRRPDGRVLLQLRPWPPGWELPGGHCDAGETAAECARREAIEETGLALRMGPLVGVYRWSGMRRASDAVFLAETGGGTPRRSLEAVAHCWVRRGRYPRAIFPWIPARLEDALDVAAGAPPRIREQPVRLVHVLFFGSSWAGTVVDGVRSLRRGWRGRPRRHSGRRR